jgi:cyclic lactone autoinducer peptide
MKITVIKKTNGKVNTMAICPWILDEPQLPKK